MLILLRSWQPERTQQQRKPRTDLPKCAIQGQNQLTHWSSPTLLGSGGVQESGGMEWSWLKCHHRATTQLLFMGLYQACTPGAPSHNRNLFYAQLVKARAFQSFKNKMGRYRALILVHPQLPLLETSPLGWNSSPTSRVSGCKQQIRSLQRRSDRSCRATNPDNYNPNGTISKWQKKQGITLIPTSKRETLRRI